MVNKKIVGRIAQVVSDREVIINRGSDHGVEVGNYFIIIGPKVSEVSDPDTDQPFEGVRHVKAVVVATEVAGPMTLAKTFLTERVNVGGNFSAAKAFAAPDYVERVETLHASPSELLRVDSHDLEVKSGDPVQVVDRDYAKGGPKVTFFSEG